VPRTVHHVSVFVRHVVIILNVERNAALYVRHAKRFGWKFVLVFITNVFPFSLVLIDVNTFDVLVYVRSHVIVIGVMNRVIRN
jgi:hypothetical protein